MSAPIEKKAQVVSLSGSPVYQHGEPLPSTSPMGEDCLEAISAHIEKYLAPVETVFHELVSDKVHIDIHIVKPTAEFPYVRLVTSGMSDLPMTTPQDDSIPKFAELLMTLPSTWKLTQSDFDDENWYWPIRLLKVLARLPHERQTWLGWGHTVPNGNPSKPYADGTKLRAALVIPSVTVPDDFHQLKISQEKTIHFLSVVPLYEAEMQLKLREGLDALLERFGKYDIDDIVDPKRRDAASKRFGLR